MSTPDRTAAGSNQILFTPYRGGNVSLPNRLVMAPMTRERAPGGLLGDESIAYYKRRAEAGMGLIITEGTWINHPVASHRKSAPRFYGEDALAQWRRVADAVHEAGAKIMPQLWHVGTGRGTGEHGFNPQLAAMGPSGIAFSKIGIENAQQLYAPMTDNDIQSCIEAFGEAAQSAHRLGFDGIELHAAHGYLIDQFFWKVTNRRTDSYNGSVRDRTRFAVEIVRQCRLKTHPQFPISLRFSQWKPVDYGATIADNPFELQEFLEPLVEAGVDIFHCSTRRYWQPAFEGSDLTLAGWTKKISGKTTMAVGSVGLDKEHQTSLVERKQGYVTQTAPIDRLLDLLEREEFDLIAVGRAVLADPAWPRKIREDAWSDLVPYSTAIRDIMY